ncbi:MAG: TonB-dependent receptor [Prolixibacteraceae bacterium]|nr:TonB-dependent receptor [Prolixibacteraceae bacterium]
MKSKRLLNVVLLIVPLLFFSLWSFGQSTLVKGTVKDVTGAPVPGATIVLKGTTQGTISDQDGLYSFKEATANGVLVFSFVGMVSQEIAISGRTLIDVILKPEISDLDEVVVVGYGTQRKEAVTGSVASIKGDEMRSVASSNITQALQGRISGVQMDQTSTKPGASMQIRIRGTRSLNASNDPLVVLDGIPFAGNISDIDPNTIKSIDILKDASATAIYGSRGANGVIMITTNKGKAGQKANLTYSGYYGVKDIFAKYPMMSGPEFAALRAASGQYKNTLDESDENNTDWQDLLYKPGMVTNHDINLTGGTESSNYSFGIGYFREEAVVPLQNFTRFSLRSNLDQQIGEYIRLGFSSNNNYSLTNGNNLGAIFNSLIASPLVDPYNEDGSLKKTYLLQTSGAQWVWTRERLEGLGDKYIDLRKAFGSYNNAYAEVKIPGIEGLKYRLNLGLNFRMTNDGSYTGEGVFSGTPTNPSTASISNSINTYWTVENILSYDRTFAEKHNLNVVALYSAEQNSYNSSNMSAKNIPADYFQFYNIGRAASTDITVNPNYQGYSVSGLMSYMGRIMYSYDNRYMLSVSYRSDASSRLADGQKWHSYPAISAGWNIKNEGFMNDIEAIDLLKLRVGYGQTSNQSVDPYKTLGLLNTRPYNFGTAYSTGYYVSELPNPNLGWEFSTTYNLGLDFGLFNNRLTGTVEYYVQNTSDVLLSLSMPGSSGVSSYMANIGETQNKGLELTLNGVIIDNVDDWTWEAGVNLYTNHNELISLASGQLKDENNWWFVGSPIDVIYDYERIGLWQEGDPYLDVLEPGGNVGMIKVKYTGEYKEDGTPSRKIDASDRQIIDIEPNFQGGFNTRVAYKGIDLNIIGTFKSGGILNSTLYGSGSYLNNLNARANNNVKVDYWTPENTDAKYPKPGGVQSSDNPKYGSTLGYFDASYLKIKAITLGYNFDRKLMKKAGIQDLRIYFSLQNPLVMFSPYHTESGMDPETNSYGNENAAVSYSYNLRRLLTIGTNNPSTRNYLFGINLTF